MATDELPLPSAAAVRARGVEAQAAPGADQAVGAGLGGERVRFAVLRLSALRAEAGRLRGRGAAGDLDHAGAGGHRRLRRLVDRADRLPEVRGLDAAVGDPRARGGLDAAQLPLPAADRGAALLVAAGDDAAAAVAGQGAADRGDAAHDVRRRSLYRRARDWALPALRLRRRGRRTRGGTVGPHRDRGPARPARAARPARQGLLPRRAAGDLRDDARGRPLPGRPVDRRLAVHLHLHLVGRRLLEAEPTLPLRRLGDDQQRAAGRARRR